MTDYIISGLRLRIEGNCCELEKLDLIGFTPFRTQPEPNIEADCTVYTDRELPNWTTSGEGIEVLNKFDFEDANADCIFARDGENFLFAMVQRHAPQNPVLMRKRYDQSTIDSNIALNREADPSLMRFALWMAFGMCAVPLNAIPTHTSVIVWQNQAVLFLGESGTGKSTHTRLWRENILGAKLLNDDSPIVSIPNGVATASGSPWSGKTHCYHNKSFPIKGIVRLSQAPHNKITRLSNIASLGALLPSCPPAFAYDEALQDKICQTLSTVIATVPIYHLECLPDADAAKLSWSTIFEQ